jgi:hypothetical protein
MRTRQLAALVLLSLPMAAAICEKPFPYVSAARPATLGEESTVEIQPNNESRRAVSREVQVPGKGTLLINAIPQNNKAQLDLVVFPRTGSSIPVAQGSPPLEAPGIEADSYYIVLRTTNSVSTRVKLSTTFKPDDPDAASGSDGKAQTAARLNPGQKATGSVDYMNMDRTDYLLVRLTETGNLAIKANIEALRGNVLAEVKPPAGSPAPIDPGAKWELKDAPPGDYLVKIAADEKGAGNYTLETSFEAGDPCGAGGDDCTQDGATELSLKPKPGSSNLAATAKDSVDFDKRDAFDWYKVPLPDKGKLAVALKPTERSAKVHAELIDRDDSDEGVKIRSGFNVDVEKKPYWIRVSADEKGAATKYVLDVEYFPNVYVEGQVVELDKRAGCIVIVNKGTNQNVRPGVNANVLANGQVMATGFVDQAFPSISRVRVTTSDCSFRPGTVVQIQGM